ncbi:hypothetical protein L6452_08169 [Arctium lappa]|uniref:Uncharacterized protein n=1 Tax=Arctium lappa TaxID=4217 RepID=A0ACB9DGS1_ARCLA|nr:hypothetical protein L6452_08169 [Arctium lappa]
MLSWTYCTCCHLFNSISSSYFNFEALRLVSLYTRLGCIKDAHNLFDEIPHKDLVSWNSIISSFSQKGDVCLSLNAFYRLRQEDGMNPNEITLISLISACGTVEGGYIHGFAVKNGLISERKVLNSLINMYGKFGYLNEASGLFEMIKLPNLVSWNSIIKIHIRSGLLEKSIMYFNLMRRAGIYPDQATIVTILQSCGDMGVGKVVDAFHGLILCSGLDKSIPTTTALLSVYAKSGRLTASYEVFREMKDRDMIAWTAMLAGYAMHGIQTQTSKVPLFQRNLHRESATLLGSGRRSHGGNKQPAGIFYLAI